MKPKARSEGLLCEEAQEELVVYDHEQKRAHRLNRSAALVWRHCDGQKSVADLAALLRESLNPQADEDLVWVALDRLDGAHLLEGAITRPTDQVRASRRQAVRKLGRVGVITLLLPAITTLVVPTPAEATSCGGCGP